MQRYSFSVAVRIWHPSIDPAVVTEKLGLNPKYTHTAGQARQTPNDRPPSGNYTESYWHSDPFGHGGYQSADVAAEDILTGVLNLLTPHKPFLAQLREQGARVHLEVASFGEQNYALVFSPELLSRCAELGLSLVHDVFPYAQDW